MDIPDVLHECAQVLTQLPVGELRDASRLIAKSLRKSGTLYLAGNGGSSSTAEHLANDVLRALQASTVTASVSCLSSNTSTVFAIANDYGFEQVFSQQISRSATQNDVLLIVSVSGASPNCLFAAEAARAAGASVISLIGEQGQRLAQLSDVAVIVPHSDYMIVENAHLVLAHILAALLKEHVAHNINEDDC